MTQNRRSGEGQPVPDKDWVVINAEIAAIEAENKEMDEEDKERARRATATAQGHRDALTSRQYRDLRSMIIQYADIERRIRDHGLIGTYHQRSESLLIGIRILVKELFPQYDEVTRERCIAFAVAVAE